MMGPRRGGRGQSESNRPRPKDFPDDDSLTEVAGAGLPAVAPKTQDPYLPTCQEREDNWDDRSNVSSHIIQDEGEASGKEMLLRRFLNSFGAVATSKRRAPEGPEIYYVPPKPAPALRPFPLLCGDHAEKIVQYATTLRFVLEWVHITTEERPTFDKLPLSERLFVVLRETSRDPYESLVVASFNDILRVESFQLVEFAGVFFDSVSSLQCDALGIELWPGYSFNLEHGALRDKHSMMGCLNVTFGVFSSTTVLDHILSFWNLKNYEKSLYDLREELSSHFAGDLILDMASGNVFEVVKIDSTKTPTFAFEEERGTSRFSLQEEYQRNFGLKVMHPHQPLVFAALREKNSHRTPIEVNSTYFILPEFCHLIGPSKVLQCIPDFDHKLAVLLQQATEFAPKIAANFLERFGAALATQTAMEKAHVKMGDEGVQRRGLEEFRASRRPS